MRLILPSPKWERAKDVNPNPGPASGTVNRRLVNLVSSRKVVPPVLRRRRHLVGKPRQHDQILQVIVETIQRDHHRRKVVKGRTVPLGIANYKEWVIRADHPRIAWRRIHPGRHNIIDKWIVNELGTFVV